MGQQLGNQDSPRLDLAHTGLEYLRQKLEGQEGSVTGMLQLLTNKALRCHHQDLADCTCGRKNQEEG